MATGVNVARVGDFCSKPAPGCFSCRFQAACLNSRALAATSSRVAASLAAGWDAGGEAAPGAAADFQVLQRAAWIGHSRRWERSLSFRGREPYSQVPAEVPNVPAAGARALRGGPGSAVPASPPLLLPPQLTQQPQLCYPGHEIRLMNRVAL